MPDAALSRQLIGRGGKVNRHGGAWFPALRLENVRHCPGRLRAGCAAGADACERVREQKSAYRLCRANGLVYVWAFSMREQLVSPAFTKRQQMLSPDQYEIVDVRTLRGVRRAMLFPKAVLQAEFEANAPLRERMAIKRKQLRAKRPAKQTSPS
jgi:hypothetical protein